MCVTTEVPALQGQWKQLKSKETGSEFKPYISRMECVQSAGNNNYKNTYLWLNY